MANANPLYPKLPVQYQLGACIGKGAFSRVYDAVDTRTQQKLAIKVIDKTSMGKEQKANVSKEISIMRKLEHPNILKLLSHQNDEDYCFLFLEVIKGGEIFNKIIEYTYFSEDLCKHIIYQLAQAVNYLHNEIGVVHRDIKPENLLFVPIDYQPHTAEDFEKLKRKSDDESKKDEGVFIPGVGGGTIGVVKLADFGLSKVLFNNETITPCGTTGYTAPEVVRHNLYSKSVDLWSVGCVMFTLLCGFSPFYDPDHNILMEKIAKGKFTFLSPWWDEISEEAKHLIVNLLNIDPIKRYTVTELLNHPWIKSLYPKRATMNIYSETNTSTYPHNVTQQLVRNFNRDSLNDDYFNQMANTQRNALTPRNGTKMNPIVKCIDFDQDSSSDSLCSFSDDSSDENDDDDEDENDDSEEEDVTPIQSWLLSKPTSPILIRNRNAKSSNRSRKNKMTELLDMMKENRAKSIYEEDFDSDGSHGNLIRREEEKKHEILDRLIDAQLVKGMQKTTILTTENASKYEPKKVKFQENKPSVHKGTHHLPKTPIPSLIKEVSPDIDEEENLNFNFYKSFNLNMSNSKMILRRKLTKDNISSGDEKNFNNQNMKIKFEATFKHDESEIDLDDSQSLHLPLTQTSLNIGLDYSPLASANKSDSFTVY